MTGPADPRVLPLLDAHRVFAALSPAARARLAQRFVVERHADGATLAAAGQLGERLALVLDGRVELHDTRHDAAVVVERGALFGAGAEPRGDSATWRAQARGDCTLAFVGADVVAALCADEPALAFHLAPPRAPVAPPVDTHLNLLSTPVRALLRRAPVTLAPTASIAEAARLMRDERVSSVLLVERDHLLGLVTDRDLRNRALAADVDPARPVVDIATVAPLTIDVAQPAFEALRLMARHNIHHMPVLDGQRVAGIVTATDVTEQHGTSAVFLAGEIYRQSSLDGLIAAAGKVQALQRHLAAARASAYAAGRLVTAITDALTTRLLQLAEARLGPPPVDYAWLAAGSQARNEQTAKSDQDNALLIDDAYDAAAHGAYFEALAQQVNDGLAACGYVHCPGDMMARNAAWRQPRRRWLAYFHRWTDEPEPMALVLTCVFFDLRCVYGRDDLLESLRRDVLQHTRHNGLFLAHMVANALTHRPPIGLFGGIAVARSGEHRGTIDLKHQGIVPIVDLARIVALAGGHPQVGTHERLSVAGRDGEIGERDARDLRDALEFLGSLRLQHQARQTAAGLAPDNHLPLDELSSFERDQLKDAFAVVQRVQNALAQRYRL